MNFPTRPLALTLLVSAAFGGVYYAGTNPESVAKTFREFEHTNIPDNSASPVLLATNASEVRENRTRPAPLSASAALEAEVAALPAGTQFSADGLPMFVPQTATRPVASAVLAQRAAMATQESGTGAINPDDGYSDHIVHVEDSIDIDVFNEALTKLDGELLRFMPEQRLATVRVPDVNADQLSSLIGAGNVAADEALIFMSTPATATVGLPASYSAAYTNVDTSIGVAVIDTGIEAHDDLNIARHVHLNAPKTELVNGTRRDTNLEALYLFDEEGNVAYDRAGEVRQHLYVTSNPEGAVVAPENLDWSALPGVDYSAPMVNFNVTNASAQAIDLHYVASADGQTMYQYLTIFPGATTSISGWPHENWVVTPVGSTERLAVLVDPLKSGAVTYGDSASADWNDGTLRVNAGAVGSLPDSQIANSCTAANAASVELWLTPGSASNYDEILVGKSSAGEHFAVRQYGNRLQVRMGIQNGAVYAYSQSGSVVAGQPMHIVARRSNDGTMRLLINGSDHWNTTINRSTPLVWNGEQSIELKTWNGNIDMLAVHCQSLSNGDTANHFNAGPDAYETVNDAFGHGTHIAGTIAGTGEVSGGEFAGIAPGAPVYDLRILNEEGRGTVGDALAAFDWLLSNAARENIRVVNLSVGKAVESSAADDMLVQGVERLVESGLVVVVSAGNYGMLGNFYVTSPGNAPNVITVGALDTNDSACINDDSVAGFSSLGPTLYDHYLKPDLIAPGSRIIAPAAKHGQMKKDHPHRLESCANGNCSDQYFRLSGTSMAAALTTGAAVLMLSKDDTLNPATVKARLMRSARKIPGDPVATGAGVLNISAALKATGSVNQAPTPRLIRASGQSTILVEDTGSLWGNEDFGADDIWSNGFLWTQGFLWTDGDLYANGFLWTDGHMWANGFLWTDSSLWSNGFLWTDHNMMANGFLWTDRGALTAQANDANGSASNGNHACSGATGEELVVGGDFESNFHEWHNSGDTNVVHTWSEHTGQRAARLTNRVCIISRPLRDQFVVGQTLTVSGYYRSPGEGWLGVGIDFFDAAGNEFDEIHNNLEGNSDDYKRFSYSSKVPPGTKSMALWLCGSSDAFYDDVSVR
ncbi:MAG: S8 family serine peptidase [Woeseiaceae bacterium]